MVSLHGHVRSGWTGNEVTTLPPFSPDHRSWLFCPTTACSSITADSCLIHMTAWGFGQSCNEQLPPMSGSQLADSPAGVNTLPQPSKLWSRARGLSKAPSSMAHQSNSPGTDSPEPFLTASRGADEIRSSSDVVLTAGSLSSASTERSHTRALLLA
ncbi:unnamed protein product [Gadus morhua 'NCC']